MDLKHILIVDDSEINCLIAVNTLEEANYRTSVAEDGLKAFQKILKLNNTPDQIDLLLTDIYMPNLTGLELIKELIKIDLHIPTIAFTSKWDKNIIVELLRLDCSEYLDKPYNTIDLLNRVKYALNKESLRQSKKELKLKSMIDTLLYSYDDEAFYYELLRLLTEFTKSRYGIFNYYDINGKIKKLFIITPLLNKWCSLIEKEAFLRC
jgi:CheY-like chemotaxis protein